MVEINLNNVSIEFPIYDSRDIQLRGAISNATTGGSLSKVGGVRVVTALKDVNLSLKGGQRVGIVGHNGAGKSTLLRVMAGIYEPSRGTVEIKGKVTAMFETATGIRPNSTGVENIRTRGILLDLSDDEIEELILEARTDSGLGDFLDLPVRTYSTGMSMRLLYSVTTFGKSDILLLDEAILTGDRAFLKGAKNRAENAMKESKLLVVTSHSKEILMDMCESGILIDKGQAIYFESIEELYKFRGDI